MSAIKWTPKYYVRWISKKLYKHPASRKRNKRSAYGNIVQFEKGNYSLRIGGSTVSCPQDWASKIHYEEQEEATK